MRRGLLPALAALIVLLLAGCGEETTSGSTTGTQPETTETGEVVQMEAVVYLVQRERIGERVRPVRRVVPGSEAVGTAAMEALLAGPTAEEATDGYSSAIPGGTELLGLDVADGTATVDLSEEFASGGGSLSMQLRVAQVVYTLTRFPTVERVAFRLDGEPVTAIGGEGVVVDPPVDRADFEAQAPPILVEEPLPGDRVSGPIRVSGTATATEATLAGELMAGSELVDEVRPVTTSEGAPARGDFSFELDPGGRTGELTVSVYEPSLMDGSPFNTVEVPVVVEP